MKLKELELKEGTSVFTRDGKEVGRINRFVLNPSTNQVTHVVVQKGWLLPEDKVVPIELISSGTDEQVVLNEDIEDFDKLPPFEETHFVNVDEQDAEARSKEYATYPAFYWYPPPQGYTGFPAYGLGLYSWPPAAAETTRNIPEDTIPLKEGAAVISADGKHVGNVERLFVEPDSNQATHFLISQGVLLKEHKSIPTQWVSEVEEDKVHLNVPTRLLERLPAYHEK